MRAAIVKAIRQQDMLKWTLLIAALLSLSACGGSQTAELAASNGATDGAAPARVLATVDEPEGLTPSPTASPVTIPTSTPSPSPTPSPTPTATPTATPIPTHTATATPTPTPLHSLAIEYMRRQTYPGSEITIEENLEPGSNYDRYIASYLSDGLRIYAFLTVPQGQKPDSGWPVVIFNHGYIPPEQYRTTERYVAYVDAFARRRYNQKLWIDMTKEAAYP
jgi:hypothetical protein